MEIIFIAILHIIKAIHRTARDMS